MSYYTLKHIHLVAIGISLALFLLRGFWMLSGSGLLRARWARIVPHINDTVLLAAGVWLAYMLRQVPGQSDWLTAKLIALVLYIALGTIALQPGRTLGARTAAWFTALLVFGYIVAVAFTKNPLPWING